MSRLKPTLEDVARAAGVSRSTVSRVVNNTPGVAAAVRETVRKAVAELGYLPDQSARALASGRARCVDVIAVTYTPVDGWLGTHPYYSRVLAGVTAALHSTDVQARIHAVESTDAERAVDAIAERATVGAVLTNVTPALAARFQQRCRRVVSLAATSSAVPAVLADNTGGAYAAVEHLHRLGRRRIAAIHGPHDNSCAIERRAGYRQAARDLGVHLWEADGDFVLDGGYDAARRLLEAHPDLDAMVVACDLMAAGAVQAITATGRHVPGDVSIVGFDDSVAAICANPPLTTMRLPVEQMAGIATRLLLDGAVRAGHRQHLPVELVPRASAS